MLDKQIQARTKAWTFARTLRNAEGEQDLPSYLPSHCLTALAATEGAVARHAWLKHPLNIEIS